MPLYQYLCEDCGLVELVRPMDERNESVDCPGCHGEIARVIASAPRLATRERGRMEAHARNERARHEPGRTSGHPPGCGCCGSARVTDTRTAANGAKSFPTRRPWMIAH